MDNPQETKVLYIEQIGSSETTRNAPIKLGEDIVQSYLKEYVKMNYFLPIHLGAPDYFNYLNSLVPLMLYTPCPNQSPCEVEGLICLTENTINNSKPESLGPYLAGLFEGEGHIVLSKSIINKSNQKIKYTSPSIAITFVNKDLPLINKLLEKYGGRLRFKNKENAIVWIINTHKELVTMINLLNGYLRTPKLIKFNELIVWLNNKYNYNIPIHSPVSNDLNENGWLAGFIDADGGFKIRYTEKLICEKTSKILRKGRIEVRFALEQRKNIINSLSDKKVSLNTEYSYEAIMLQIYSFFGLSTDLRQSTHNVDKTYFIVEVTSLTKLNKLILYLQTYPLLTAKRNDFEDWVKVYNLMFDNKHLTDSGKLLIKQIKSNMNRKRGEFNWDHLNYLNKVQ